MIISKYFQPRQDTSKAKNEKEGDCLNKSNECVECKGHVPAYLNFMCEDCYTIFLNAKLVVEDAAEFIKQAKRNQK